MCIICGFCICSAYHHEIWLSLRWVEQIAGLNVELLCRKPANFWPGGLPRLSQLCPAIIVMRAPSRVENEIAIRSILALNGQFKVVRSHKDLNFLDSQDFAKKNMRNIKHFSVTLALGPSVRFLVDSFMVVKATITHLWSNWFAQNLYVPYLRGYFVIMFCFVWICNYSFTVFLIVMCCNI